MSNSILMRFRNLRTEDAMGVHLDVIKEKGYVWLGWWAKPEESLPIDKMDQIEAIIKSEGSIMLFMAESHDQRIIPCKVVEVKYSSKSEEKIDSPEPECTPAYYASDQMYLWLKIAEIQDGSKAKNFLSKYAFADYESFMTEDSSEYLIYDGKWIDSTLLIFFQRRTLMLLRDKRKGDKKGTEWIRPKKDFLSNYSLTNSNSILVISDLHFSDNPTAFAFADCTPTKSRVKRTLSVAIDRITSHQEFAALICAGDFSHQTSPVGFEKADESLFSITNNHKIDKENVVIVPGNHDMAFTDPGPTPDPTTVITHTLDEAKVQYEQFYKKIIDSEPNEFCAMGRKLLLKNRLPIEIVGLNSCCLQQEKGHFVGMGFVGDDQLDLVEEEMGWKEKDSSERPDTNAFRILVLHHHLYPVEWALEPERDYAYSTCLDAVRIMRFAARNHVNLIIHGHKHQFDFAQMRKWIGDKQYWYNILGMGSTSSTDIASTSNCIGILDFNKKNELKIQIIALPNGDVEELKEMFSVVIPVNE